MRRPVSATFRRCSAMAPVHTKPNYLDQNFDGLNSDPTLPFWNGEVDTFETFEQECRWAYEGIKPSLRPYLAARIRNNLRGEPREHTKDIDPGKFTGVNGVFKLLSFLKGKLSHQPLERLALKLCYKVNNCLFACELT